MIAYPPVTPVDFPSSATGVLNSSSPEMTVPTVNRAIPLENPSETSVPAQEISSPEEANIQTSGDQPNGVAATQEMTKQTEESGLEATPVSQQGETADPAGASAGLPVPEESTPFAEAPTKEVQCQESVVAAEEVATAEVKQISVEEKTSGEELGTVAEKIPGDTKPSAPEDVGANREDGKMAEGTRNLCLDVAQDEVLPGDVNIDVATQNENLDKKEPVILISKGIQSKGTSCEGPPVSTHHLSGWFHHPPFVPIC